MYIDITHLHVVLQMKIISDTKNQERIRLLGLEEMWQRYSLALPLCTVEEAEQVPGRRVLHLRHSLQTCEDVTIFEIPRR